MATYHLGEEIRKEIQRQGMSVDTFADRIYIQRQSVYDIFKRSHIATDQLADISRVLNRDFFQELSVLYRSDNDQQDLDASQEEKPITKLRPADELHVLCSPSEADAVFAEYIHSERRQPLVVFYAADTEFDVDYLIGRWERAAGKADIDTARDIHRDTLFQEWGDDMRIDQTPGLTSIVYMGRNYYQAIANAVELMATPGRHIVLLMPVVNALYRGKSGGLVYDDVVEGCFLEWAGKVHFAVVQDAGSTYLRLREYYHAYLGDGIIDRLVKKIAQTGEFEKRLLDLTVHRDILTSSELQAPDDTGLTRLQLSMPDPDGEERELLFSNGVNNNPHLTMWIDIRNGYLVDYQYREHPLIVPIGTVSNERLDRKAKIEPEELPIPEKPDPMPEVLPGTKEYDERFAEVMDALNNLDANNTYNDRYCSGYEEVCGVASKDADIFDVTVSRDRIVMSDIFLAKGAVEPNEWFTLTIADMEAVAKLIIFLRLDHRCGEDLTGELSNALIDYYLEQGYDQVDRFVPLLKSLDIDFKAKYHD